MPFRLHRRDFAVGLAASLAAIALPRGARAAEDALTTTCTTLERRLDARLGVAIRDTATGRRWRHRGDERFPLCSTFKVLAAAALLAKVDAGHDRLDRRVVLAAADLVSYSPATKDRVGGNGITLAELCAAAITRSDNTAGNAILAAIGGPDGVTAFARRLGDHATRLDRCETELNQATPGDPRDTTTPAAMAADLEALVLGETLSAASRDQLIAWMRATTTGGAKLRAGLPPDWQVGDKTGGGGNGAMADVAAIWPPGRAPIFVAVYIADTSASFDDRNAAIAELARTLSATL
jgi:beta-lactamase class A